MQKLLTEIRSCKVCKEFLCYKPRPVCAPLWHAPLLNNMRKAKLIILMGQYSQNCYLGETLEVTLTGSVNNYKTYLPFFKK